MLMQCPCGGGGGTNPLLLLAVFAGAWLLFNWIKMLMKSKGAFMSKSGKIIIVIVLIAIVGIVIAIKQQAKNSSLELAAAANSDTATVSKSENPGSSQAAEDSAKLPHLIDLGAGKCIPCKMMKPILDDLTQNYNEQFKVTFIDVWENTDQAKGYNVKMIPTQIFYDAEGKELFRHEGFYSKEDILGKWKELGIEMEKGADNESN
jgi:thioredoxin 1